MVYGTGPLILFTRILPHLAIVEAVQADALAVNLSEAIAGVCAMIHLAGRIQRHGVTSALHVHQFPRIPDAPALVVFHFDLAGATYLDGIARQLFEEVERNPSTGVAPRAEQRMRPHAVAPNVAECRTGHAEIAGSFLQQDAARGVVAAASIVRPAV